MKLTDTQFVLLSAVSQREDRGEVGSNLKGVAAHNVLTEGLVEEVPACGDPPIWRRDEGNRPLALRIRRHAERLSDLLQPAAADAVHALLVFLHLLERDAERVRQLGLAELAIEPLGADALADRGVQEVT